MYYPFRQLLMAASLFCLYAPLQAQEQPRHYSCYQVTDTLHIDGRLDEAAWQQAPWSADFVDIEGMAKPRPALRTRMKMLWNRQYLYIAAELEEPHVWASLLQRDTIIYHDNDFEVFIDPDRDAHQYFEIEVNAHNTVMDLFMPRPYRDGGQALLGWDAKGLRSAVHINGSLNQPQNKDQGWTLEMAIPFSALGFYNRSAMPANGTRWRINFSRVQWDTDVQQGAYVKRRNAAGRPLPEHNWVWSPQGIIDMHAPERWGYVVFRTAAPGSATDSFALPPLESAQSLLWQVYYQQRRYRQANGRYASTLQALGLNSAIRHNGHTFALQLESTATQFSATLRDEDLHNSCSINQEGKISKTILP